MSLYSVCFILVCFYPHIILPSVAERANNWTDVIMVQEGTPVTLPCSDGPDSLAEQITWMMMRDEENRWTSLLSVNTSQGLTDRLINKLKRMGEKTFEIFEDVSLQFVATATDGGRYSCLMQQRGRKLKEKIILLALVKLTLAPAPSIPVGSTMRLKAQVSPSYAVAGGMWVSPTGVQLLTAVPTPGTLLTKLPLVSHADNGCYTCCIYVQGQSSKTEYRHTLTVTVTERDREFLNITYGPTVSKASLSHSAVTLSCPPLYGDYLRLYWWSPGKPTDPELIFQFDRWRNHTKQEKSNLQLIAPSSSAATGNFSFLLWPALANAGRYQCEVFLDDVVLGQSTTLTVLHGYARTSSSSLDLTCMYSERSQVKSVRWKHTQRPNFQLTTNAMLGKLTISISLPITPETAGLYVCTLQLKNKQTVISYVYDVTLQRTVRPCCVSELPAEVTTHCLPPAEGNRESEPYTLHPSLSLLIFLVPLVATAVGVLLWRRGCCASRRNRDVEHTLSYYSGEVENIYENPEDLRQSPPHSAVYMDLKPTGEPDVYKELDRYDPCCD